MTKTRKIYRNSTQSKNFKKLEDGIQLMEFFHEDFNDSTIKKYFLNFDLKSEKFSIFDEETVELFLDFYAEKKFDFLLDIENFTKNFFLISSCICKNGYKHLPTNNFFLKNESFWLEIFHNFFVDHYNELPQNEEQIDLPIKGVIGNQKTTEFFDLARRQIDNDPIRISTRTEEMLVKCLPFNLDNIDQKYHPFVRCFYENKTKDDNITLWSEMHDFLKSSEKIMSIIASDNNTLLIEEALVVSNIFYFQLCKNKIQVRLPSHLENLNVSIRTINKYSTNQLNSLTEYAMFNILSHSILELKKKNTSSSNFVGSLKNMDIEKFKKKLRELNKLKSTTIAMIDDVIDNHIKVQMNSKKHHIENKNDLNDKIISDQSEYDNDNENDDDNDNSDKKRRISIIEFINSRKICIYPTFVNNNLSCNTSNFICRLKDALNKQEISYVKWIPIEITPKDENDNDDDNNDNNDTDNIEIEDNDNDNDNENDNDNNNDIDDDNDDDNNNDIDIDNDNDKDNDESDDDKVYLSQSEAFSTEILIEENNEVESESDSALNLKYFSNSANKEVNVNTNEEEKTNKRKKISEKLNISKKRKIK